MSDMGNYSTNVIDYNYFTYHLLNCDYE